MKRLSLALVFACCLLPGICSGAEGTLYYVRYSETVRNGTLVDTNLLMIPRDDEFRWEKFSSYRVGGMGTPGSSLPIEAAVQHNAIANLLVRAGLKSVKNQSSLTNGTLAEETIMNYEGAIRLPSRALDYRFDADKGIMHGEFEIAFSPLAFPSEWGRLQRQGQLRQALGEFFAQFH